MKKVSLSILIAVAFVSVSLGQKAHSSTAKTPAKTEWAVVADGKFTSRPVGMTMPLPDEFIVISTADAETLSVVGTDMLKQGAASGGAIDAAANRTIMLLAIAEKPIGTPQNSVLEIATVKQAAGVTAKMSLSANLAVLQGSPLTLTRNLGALKVGKNTFQAADLDGRFGAVTFKQRMYVSIHRGYSLLIAITYESPDQLAALEDVLAGLTLTR